MVCSSLFWIAPRSPLVEDTLLIAVSDLVDGSLCALQCADVYICDT